MVTAPPQLLHDSYILHDFLIMFLIFLMILINTTDRPTNWQLCYDARKLKTIHWIFTLHNFNEWRSCKWNTWIFLVSFPSLPSVLIDLAKCLWVWLCLLLQDTWPVSGRWDKSMAITEDPKYFLLHQIFSKYACSEIYLPLVDIIFHSCISDSSESIKVDKGLILWTGAQLMTQNNKVASSDEMNIRYFMRIICYSNIEIVM